ncbi:hypothetical protein HDV00_002076 [Rhizophlyctis rosea]|nr:hypothetical protein HDV00_002076 [Rhizophlyctis rosea]
MSICAIASAANSRIDLKDILMVMPPDPHYIGSPDSIPPSPCNVEISLLAIAHNISHIASLLAPSTTLCIVLKADAYGLGLDAIAPVVITHKDVGAIGICDDWEVGMIGELIKRLWSGGATPGGKGQPPRLIRLRPTTVTSQILGHAYGVEEVIGTLSSAVALDSLSKFLHHRFKVNVEVDIGMGRLSFPNDPDGWRGTEEVFRLEWIDVIEICAHYPWSSTADEEKIFNGLEIFEDFVHKVWGLAGDHAKEEVEGTEETEAQWRLICHFSSDGSLSCKNC